MIRQRQVPILLSLLCITVACAGDSSTAPVANDVGDPSLYVGGLDRNYTIQLRTFPNDPLLPPNPIYGHGHLTIRSGATLGDACLPPNPITPTPGFTALTICGKIFNDGGALYRGGGIYTVPAGLGDGVLFITSLNGAFPTDPCRRYDLAGSVEV